MKAFTTDRVERSAGDTLTFAAPRALAPADLIDAFVEVCAWPPDPQSTAPTMPTSPTIRVVIADDHPLVLSGIDHLLRDHDGFEVVAQCATGAAALDAVKLHGPDILLLDLQLPDMDGVEVLRRVGADPQPRPRVVLLTAGLHEDQLIEAMRLGVRGVVLKEMAPTLLVQCLRRVHAGGQWIEKDSANRAMAKLVRNEDQRRKLATMLTPREIEIVRLVRRGLANRQIAETLGVAEGTVKVHLHNIYEKLSVQRRGELIAFADEYGLS